MNDFNVLGVGFLAEASACVVRNGTLVSAVSEERLNRIKNWYGMPHGAIRTALELAGLSLDDIDVVASYGALPAEPDAHAFEEKDQTIRSSDLPAADKERQLGQLKSRLEHERVVITERAPAYLAQIRALGRPLQVVPHHEAHAASAYYGSGWDDCLVLTVDGWGEDGSATIWHGSQVGLRLLARSHTFDSLGYFYGSITKSLGFTPKRHEGKVLGLAAHCQAPRSYPLIRSMIDYDASSRRFIGRMERGVYVPRFDNPELKERLREFAREDIAAAAQKSLEEVVCACVAGLDGQAGRLALAGGTFANVKLNQRLRELENVGDVFVFPDMGDGGLPVGAAWLVHARETGQRPERLRHVYLGPSASEREIGATLAASGLRYSCVSGIESRVASLLAAGHVVARWEGRLEYGPRALGHRSILFQATDPSVNDWLNQRLGRSEFMPFAPVTLAEAADSCYAGLSGGREAARYMTMTFSCTSQMRAEAPAAVHVDGTARPQIVSRDDCPSLYEILEGYRRITGRSSLINTSLNMHEEPIVSTVDDALRAVRASDLPYLAVGNFLVELGSGELD